MAALMLSLQVASESELSSVPSKLIITPSGHHLHKSKIAPQENTLKNICMNVLCIKYYAMCSDEQLFFGFFGETIFEGIE